MYQNYGSSMDNNSWGIEERPRMSNQFSKPVDDSTIKPGEIRWSLLKYNAIPSNIKREYDELLNDHNNKKKIKEETFFKQKVTDYLAYYKGKEVDMSYYKSKNGSNSFSAVEGVHRSILKNLEMLNFTNMTAIQQTTLPLALKGHDLIGCSDTGSGKTLAFLIPILTQLLNFADDVRNNPNSINTKQKNFLAPSEFFPPYMTCPYVLIMAPTRELAEQINAEARKLIYGLGLNSVAVYGGIQKNTQSRKLEHGCEILVATPGRLNDMLKQRMASLRFVKYLILDEADTMLDMGFLPQIKQTISDYDLCEKSNRQNLMFSATFEDEIQNLAKEFLNDYYFVTNGSGQKNKEFDTSGLNSFQSSFISTNTVSKWKVKENIKQIILPAKDQDYKIDYIVNTFNQGNIKGAIVFVDKKMKVDEIRQALCKRNIPSTSIHGDKAQEIRNIAVNDFKLGKYKVIVATNIIARGLDFVEVDYVFNFDLPMNIEDYIHRIGRTGRLGQMGYAVTFVEKEDKFKKIMRDLITYMRKCDIEVPGWLGSLFPDLANLCVKKDTTNDSSKNFNDNYFKEEKKESFNNGSNNYGNSNNYNNSNNGNGNYSNGNKFDFKREGSRGSNTYNNDSFRNNRDKWDNKREDFRDNRGDIKSGGINIKSYDGIGGQYRNRSRSRSYENKNNISNKNYSNQIPNNRDRFERKNDDW